MNVNQAIDLLVKYAIDKKLIDEEDKNYAVNRVLSLMGLLEYSSGEDEKGNANTSCVDFSLHEILKVLIDDAVKRGVIEPGITSSDIFDSKLMDVFVDRPSLLKKKFYELYEVSPKEATDWFYDYSKATNYIRCDRIKKDRRWKYSSEYGDIDISINLSKPEKDPKDIANALKMTNVAYPKCQLCVENEGYEGRSNHPARSNHRIMPIKVAGEDWGFQYSPYVYFNEHSIVLNSRHVPMKIDRRAFEKLFSFVKQFPHYLLGSNADLPIVGGSILTHDHFQGGHYTFAMEKASVESSYSIDGFSNVSVGILHWPMSVIRLSGKDCDEIINLAEIILDKWRAYTDEEAGIFAFTDGVPHNTITPIARCHGDIYEMDLALRNNIVSDEHPLGVFHPHKEYHHIKKENIGLIEVMGLAILPARLNEEINEIKKCLINKKNPDDYPQIGEHLEWVKEIKTKYDDINEDNIDSILENEIGEVFVKVLENAGVYKCTEEGRKYFKKFIESI